MRDYAKVGPKFWIGETGKKLRGTMEARIVAMYLMSSPHANMLGLYYVPKMFIAHETGLGLEGACKGLSRAIEAGFCEYDEASETVWVMEMATYQIADNLSGKDLRIKGVQNEYESLPNNPFLSRFYDKYAKAFCMTGRRGERATLTADLEAPSKPLGSQEQEQEQEQAQEHEHEQDQAQAQAAAAETPPRAFTAVDLSIAMRAAGVLTQPANPMLIALANQGVSPETATAACEEAKRAKPDEQIGPAYVFKILERWAKDAAALKVAGATAPKSSGGAWWVSDSAIIAKGLEMALQPTPGERMPDFKARIQAAIDNGGVPPAPPRMSLVGIAQAPLQPKSVMSDEMRATLKNLTGRSAATSKELA
jgi:hypothetical protein